jgi:ADP-heptose:LPS heptosyltransferase
VEILIIHPGGLGDVILSLPAVALFRRKFPAARITVAGNVDHLVPVMSGYAEKIQSISKLPLHRLYSSDALNEEDARFWRSYDLIVSWTGGGNSEFTARFRAIHPNVCVAAWKPVPGETRHVSRLFVDSLNLGTAAGIEAEPATVLLSPGLRAQGREWLKEHGWNGQDCLTALHPGAGSETKRWPVLQFVELARHLITTAKRKLLIIEGSAETGLAEQVLSALPAGRAIVFNVMSLELLSAVLAPCDLFIGNDSGVAHLAAALNVRCTVLFGPTLPGHWAPLGSHVTILRNAQGCEGCASRISTHTCLENITVGDVIRNSGCGTRD